MKELSIQKGLTYGMMTSLVSIPFTGPVGLIGAGSFLVAKMCRGMNNEYTRKKLLNEKKELKEKKMEEKIKKEMTDLLIRNNERQSYISSMEEGSYLLKNYLTNLPGREYPRIKQIEVIEKENTFLGFPTSKRSLEVRTIK